MEYQVAVPVFSCFILVNHDQCVTGKVVDEAGGGVDYQAGAADDEHIRRLDVRHIFEHGDQLRQVVELGKASLGPIARPLGNEFVKMIFVSFLNSNIYPLKNLLTSRVCISLETPYSKASSHFPIASHLQ